MIRRFEQGSVVGFVVVGIVLTAALIGGIWLSRHPIGSSEVADKTGTTNVSRDDEEAADESDASSDASATTDEELKQTLAQQSGSSSTDESSQAVTSGTSTSLPVTGPADVVMEMLGATLLAGATVAYVRSRTVA